MDKTIVENFKKQIGFGLLFRVGFIYFGILLFAGVVSIFTGWAAEPTFLLAGITYPLLVLLRVFIVNERLQRQNVEIVLTKAEKIKANLFKTTEKLDNTSIQLREVQQLAQEQERELNAKTQEINQLKSTKADFKSVLHQQSQIKEDLEQTCKDLKSENKDLIQKLEDFKIRERDLLKKIKELNENSGDLEKTKQDFNQKEQDFKKNEVDLTRQLENLNRTCQNLKSQNEDLNITCNNLKSEREDLTLKVKDLRSRLKGLGAIKGKYEKLKLQLQKKDAQLEPQTT